MIESATEFLGPDGPIANAMDGYESRPEQMDMVRAVEEALLDECHLLVEAGTGVGKSFAYLVPAITHAMRGEGRVVVSTNTIALQEQLVHKDIPFLESVLPWDFKAVLVKGRTNYLGIRRLQRAASRTRSLFSTPEQESLDGIVRWAYETEDGSLADMPNQPPFAVWDKVNSDRDDCLGRRCRFFDKCFYQRARKEAEDADLLVINHALLFSDLAVRAAGGSILPDYSFVILDEAHTAEAVAVHHFGESVTNAQVHYVLNRLFNPRTGKGFLKRENSNDIRAVVDDARDACEAYFGALGRLCEDQPSWNGRLSEPAPVEERVSTALSGVREALKHVRKQTEEEDQRIEIRAMEERCLALSTVISGLHQQRHPSSVYWLEAYSRSTKRQVAHHGRPIEVTTALRESLFDRVKSVVMTSATLTTEKRSPFAYIRRQLGLEEEEAKGVSLGSPFDYQHQVTVYIEDGMPAPDSTDYLAEVVRAIKAYLLKSMGRAFVLFTNYTMLKDCTKMLEGFFVEHGMTALSQGSGLGRSNLLSAFREGSRSVLLGTDTFWSGVDVPGEKLSNVIITKLPFAVPSHPVVEARIEMMKERGEEPFTGFQLPESILKFKQGFGRLIRTKRDSGIVVILDPRVRTRSYGRWFIEALPDCKVEVCRLRDGGADGH